MKKYIAVILSLGIFLWPVTSIAAELSMPEMPQVDAVQSGLDIFSDVEIWKTADKLTAAPGEEINYTIKVKNHGPNPAESVLSVDQLPLKVEFIASDRTDYDAFTGMWSIGDMQAGEEVLLHIQTRVKANATGEIKNIADVTATGIVDNLPSNNFAKAIVNVDPNAYDSPDGGDAGGGTPPPPPPAPGGSISGQVFNDLDGNGEKDEDESSLSGWKVYLDSNDNAALDEGETFVITASPYLFDNLAEGGYIVRVSMQDGWKLMAPAEKHAVTIVNSKSIDGKDFAVKQVQGSGGGEGSGGGSSGGSISGGTGGGGVASCELASCALGGGGGGPAGQVLGDSTGAGGAILPGLQMSDIPQGQVLGATILPRTGMPVWMMVSILLSGFIVYITSLYDRRTATSGQTRT